MSSLIKKLSARHPEFQFEEAEHFSWSPTKQTIFYSTTAENAAALTLHELAHALLGHSSYRRDVELVAMESAAWEKATAYIDEHAEITALTGGPLSEAVIQDHLDTYRDWLHARSTCPACTANGYQTAPATYSCPACTHTWRVNEARVCALRRYSTKR